MRWKSGMRRWEEGERERKKRRCGEMGENRRLM